MTNKPTNKHALYSRKLLQDALLELLKVKTYSKITVTDIVTQAELSRPTFYAYFETKDVLLMSYVDDLLDDIYSIFLENQSQTDGLKNGRSIFDAWAKRKEVFELIRSADVDYLIIKKIKEQHHRLLNEFPPLRPTIQLNPVLREYCISYMAGSIAMVIIKWMDNGMKHPPKHMNHLMQLILSGDFELIAKQLNNVLQ